MTYLFLDDFRDPKNTFMGYMYMRGMDADIYKTKEWVVVKDYDEFVKWITQNGIPDVVSLDHDLADVHYCPEDEWDDYEMWAQEQEFVEKTGMDCVKWLVNYCHDNHLIFPTYYIHSANPHGVENMKSYIQHAIRLGYITTNE